MAKLKNVAIFVLATLILFSVCALATGCSDGAKITKLQQQIAELENKIEEQDGKIGALEDEIENQDQKNTELKNQIDQQNGKIEELEKENKNLSNSSKNLAEHTNASFRDEQILRYYHEPTKGESFEDNKVIIILKSSYDKLDKISFNEFKIVEQVSEINCIEYNLHQYRRENGNIIYLEEEENHMFTLELAVNNKQAVLNAISQLQTLDMVLVAEPSYILDKEVEKQIEQDYARQYGYVFHYDKYYGTYGDCVVLFVQGDAAVIKTIIVADSVFQYNYDWEIYVWKSGELATIETAYSMSWLSLNDIHTIAYRHAKSA